MTTFERIVGVAVELKGEVYALPAPGRHGQAIRLIIACMPDDPDAGLKATQGFITDRSRYVSREEAREIVRRHMRFGDDARVIYPRLKNHAGPGGWPEPSHHPTQLFS